MQSVNTLLIHSDFSNFDRTILSLPKITFISPLLYSILKHFKILTYKNTKIYMDGPSLTRTLSNIDEEYESQNNEVLLENQIINHRVVDFILVETFKPQFANESIIKNFSAPLCKTSPLAIATMLLQKASDQFCDKDLTDSRLQQYCHKYHPLLHEGFSTKDFSQKLVNITALCKSYWPDHVAVCHLDVTDLECNKLLLTVSNVFEIAFEDDHTMPICNDSYLQLLQNFCANYDWTMQWISRLRPAARSDPERIIAKCLGPTIMTSLCEAFNDSDDLYDLCTIVHEELETVKTMTNLVFSESMLEETDEYKSYIDEVIRRLDIMKNFGYAEYLKRVANKNQHAINGNFKPASQMKGVKKTLKKEVKKELKKDVKKALNQGREVRIATAKGKIKLSNKKPVNMKKLKTIHEMQTSSVRQALTKESFLAETMALACPGQYPSFRKADEFNTESTGLASLSEQIPIDFCNGAALNTTHAYLPATDFASIEMRSALRRCVLYYANASNKSFEYELHGTTGSNLAGIDPVEPAPQFDTVLFDANYKQALPTPIALPTGASVIKPHGEAIFAGSSVPNGGDPRRFFWLDYGSVFKVTFSSDQNADITLILDLWTPQAEVPNALEKLTTATAFAVYTATFNAVGRPGYYALSAKSSIGLTVLSITSARWTCSASAFGHHCLTQLENKIATIPSLNRLGRAMMFTNDAPPIYEEGKVVGYQSPRDTQWTTFVTSGDNYNNITKMPGHVFFNANEGIYGFARPTSEQDLQPEREYQVENGIFIDSFYALRNASPMLVIYGKIANTAGYQDGHISLFAGVEFTTNDQWYDVRAPDVDAVARQKRAFRELARIPQWHKNPVHLNDIWNTIVSGVKKGATFIKKYGPTAMSIAGLLA
jgi:hypothetical protein